eukprot:COSAG01_NODE_1444_length_10282_cov_17.103506_10_plen_217_part_00
MRHAQCTRSVLAAWCQPWALLPGCPPPGQPWKTCEVPLYVSAPAMSFQAKAVLESPRNSKVDNIDVRGGRSWQRCRAAAWQRPYAAAAQRAGRRQLRRRSSLDLRAGSHCLRFRVKKLLLPRSAALPLRLAPACCLRLPAAALQSTRPPLLRRALAPLVPGRAHEAPKFAEKAQGGKVRALSHRPSLPHSIPAARTAHRCDDHILELSESTPPVLP